MKLFANDLATARMVYGDRDPGREPEMTIRIPKGKAPPSVGDEVTLHNSADSRAPTARCTGEVLAVAVIVRPDWTSYTNPKAEREQGSLL